MSKVNVLIVEDSLEEGTMLSDVLLNNHYNVVGIASRYEEALNYFYSCKIDILIIDIFFDGHPEGINLAQTINATPNGTRPFVFLTSSSDRQIFEKAKLTRPFSYLLKPFNELEILYAIELAIEKFYGQENTITTEENTLIGSDSIFIKKGKNLKKVSIDEIIYIEVEERYCNVVTNTEKFVVQISLTKILPILEAYKFVRTHRNFLVNTDKIIEVTLSENVVLLEGNHSITLSDKYKGFLSNYKIL
ncbi:LytR/AlgR family response regulator transcription factor [Chryseobacterium sp. FH1]|uniref:LytR/AlgR family response regulator transcription factor n=1 Tax=Chryseobacterium sp. FH1 TaxID=1233951 RepID=UPI0004E2C846|nr:response regulator transcription factor [Chryseobacterium sp. FH1]KFC19662.1 LytTR family transcriptional regulator [Chryseobacterium sp. FH1]